MATIVHTFYLLTIDWRSGKGRSGILTFLFLSSDELGKGWSKLIKLIQFGNLARMGKYSARIRVSSLKWKFTTLLLNFFSCKSSNNIAYFTSCFIIHRFDNQYNFPSLLLPFHRHQYHPSITWNHADQSFRSTVAHSIAKLYPFFPRPRSTTTHFTAIESCSRWSNTRALFCLAISPRESLMRDNIGQAVLSRLTAFIRPEIARETTNNCAVYQ